MENEIRHNPELARNVAALSAPPDADQNSRPALARRGGIAAVTLLGFAVLLAGFGGQVFHKVATLGTTTSDESLNALQGSSHPVEAVAPPGADSAVLLGAGTLVATYDFTLRAASPVSLLGLSPGQVIGAGDRAFSGAPVLPFTVTILAIDLSAASVRVMARDDFTLILPVSQDQLSKVRIGDGAEVTMDALPAKTFKAEVVTIAPFVTAGRGTIDVHLRLVDAHPEFRPNMAARVRMCGCLGEFDNLETETQ
ncbi:MAG: efflux RND transporter periplasmic adaptor subunit [Natronohydrobacter sp.]|nr:efflux RND transporter periplasmic adaptor subunit [Natronohydrobacter sp.]